MKIKELTLTTLNELNLDQYRQLLSQLSDTLLDSYQLEIQLIKILTSSCRIFILGSLEQAIGTMTLLIEPKLIHQNSRVVHIEDVVIDKKHRGKGYGHILIQCAKQVAEEVGAYKIILNCIPDRKGFYESCGFRESGLQMRFDV